MCSAWLQNLLRPSIKSLHVRIYENNQEKDITKYDDFRHVALIKSVNAALRVDEKSPYWFETDVYEHRKCFKPVKTTMEVTCYTQDKRNPTVKRPVSIPPRYRKKLFDKRHPIHPEKYSSIIWPSNLEVRFVHLEM